MKPLPRRALLGAELPADDDAFSPSGTRLAAVTDGGMAARAGLRAGDTLVMLASLPVRSLAELAAALRRAGASTSTELHFMRGTDALSGTAPVAPVPHEELEGVGISYGELAAAPAPDAPAAAPPRLRTIGTRVPEPRATILILPGLSLESVEADSPLAELAHGWARAGFDTLRFDRRGVGDSEGGPAGDLDFATELADATLALAVARTRAREREVPLVLFGHGAGALVAASLAGAHHVHGLITYGAPSSRWLASLADLARREGELRGDPPDALDRAAAAVAPRVLASGAAGRCAAYHAQLDALDPAALWSKVTAPLLVLRGEHDWVVRPDDQAGLATLAAGTSTVLDLPGLDHVFGRHADRASALRDFGAAPVDPSLIDATARWLADL